jgi:hypothetical protein
MSHAQALSLAPKSSFGICSSLAPRLRLESLAVDRQFFVGHHTGSTLPSPISRPSRRHNLPGILKGFHHSAQGWTAKRDYPGKPIKIIPYPEGVKSPVISIPSSPL